MTKDVRNALIELTVAIVLTYAVDAAAGGLPAWAYLVALFAGLGIGSAVAAGVNATLAPKTA